MGRRDGHGERGAAGRRLASSSEWTRRLTAGGLLQPASACFFCSCRTLSVGGQPNLSLRPGSRQNEFERHGPRDRKTGGVCRTNAMGGRSRAGAAAHKAGIAGHAGGYPRRRRTARGETIARAAGGDRRQGCDGLCTRLALRRSAYRRAVERHCRALDRALRGSAARLGPGGNAGSAGRAGSRRARAEPWP